MIISETRRKYLRYLSEKMKEKVASERLYIQPHLTLTELAEMLEISRNDLSYIINTYIGKSFVDFINEMRVDEALRLIKANRGKRIQINELSRLVGFKDRTTFCRACKKLTGMSPIELETQFTDYTL